MRHELQEGAPAILERGANAAQHGILVVDPVQGVEGHDEVERVAIGKRPRIADLEFQVRALVLCEMRPREGDHPGRRIDAENRALRQALRDLGGNLALAAADVENALRAGELELGEVLVRDRFCSESTWSYLCASHSVIAALRSDPAARGPGRIKVAAPPTVKPGAPRRATGFRAAPGCAMMPAICV